LLEVLHILIILLLLVDVLLNQSFSLPDLFESIFDSISFLFDFLGFPEFLLLLLVLSDFSDKFLLFHQQIFVVFVNLLLLHDLLPLLLHLFFVNLNLVL
jgi:hypothetical protein